MLGTGKNVGDVRLSNCSLIFKLLYFEGAQSRKSLAHKAALTPAAVTMLTTELMEMGCIVDSAQTVRNGRAGRSEQPIDLNYRRLFVLGMHMEKQFAQLRIYSLGLQLMEQMNVPVDYSQEPDALFEYLCDKIAFIMVKAGVTSANLLGIGVTINGIVDPVSGVSISSFSLIPDNTPIKAQIEQRLRIQVQVNNNVRSMLMAEAALNHRSQGVSHLFVKYGPGLGGALSVSQQTYNGATYRAMELGHLVVQPDGALCRCGRRGCLETVLSFPAILREAKEQISPEQTPVLYHFVQQDGLTMTALAASLSARESVIQKLITDKFRLFTLYLESFVTLLDPQTVSVCSEIFCHKPFQEIFNGCIHENARAVESRLVLNPDSEKIEQVAAAALVVHSFLEGQTL